MRAIATALRRTYDDTDGNSRDSRVFGFVPMATWSVATSSLPAWMIVSSVYVYFDTTATWMAASRLYARNPDVVSGTSVSDAWRTTHEPAFCRRFFSGEKCSIVSVSRSPTTRSARPSTIGATSFGMSEPMYWLSASVLTTTSAPSFRQASRPAWKPAARPLLFVSLTMWSTPFSRATSIVRSVEPSSMMSHSTTSMPGTSRGRSASVAGSVSSSLRQGIWMMSFIANRRGAGARGGWPLRTGYGVRRRDRPPQGNVHWSALAVSTHGKRDAHPDATGPARGPGPPPALGAVARDRPRRAHHRNGRRLHRPADVPQLRQLLLAALGTGGAARHPAELRRLPGADRAPARDRVRRGPRARRRRRRPDHGRRDVRLVRPARGRAVPARARVVHGRRRARRRRAAVHALRLPVPRGARVHRHPVPGAHRLGGRARGRPATA